MRTALRSWVPCHCGHMVGVLTSPVSRRPSPVMSSSLPVCLLICAFSMLARVLARLVLWIVPRRAFPSLGSLLERRLGVAVAGAVPPPATQPIRVAVVGGGIAGAGCAYALAASPNHRVTLFDARDALGGNAKTGDWAVQRGLSSVRTGLSVLAWPRAYFHNYVELLQALRVPTASVRLPFAVRATGPNGFTYWQDEERSWAQFPKDLAAFDRAARLVAAVNAVYDFIGALLALALYLLTLGYAPRPQPRMREKCVYAFHWLSPFNLLPLRTLCRAFGMSPAFWDTVAVPIWSSTFLSGSLNSIPASIAPVLKDIMPLAGVVEMDTWTENSGDVFQRMTQGMDVRVRSKVVAVAVSRVGTLSLYYSCGSTVQVATFDRVVFACPASVTASILTLGQQSSACAFTLERRLLGGVTFAEPRDTTFLQGAVHSDPSVLPPDMREALLARYANFVSVDPVTKAVENTFLVSPWCPAAQALGDAKPSMLVTYAAKPRDDLTAVGTVDNTNAHPELSVNNQLRALLLRLVQGRCGVYYCGASATLANGHDLSLTSGFACAAALGAQLPFTPSPAAARDLAIQRSLMGL